MAVKMKSHTGIIAVGIFLFFAATMALIAGTTLVWRGSILDRVWVVNAPAYAQLARFGKTIGVPFLLLGAILMVAGAGWFRRRLWGWRLAVAIIAIQVLGDVVNAFAGDAVRGGVAFVVAGALLFYLLRPEVRSAFASSNDFPNRTTFQLLEFANEDLVNDPKLRHRILSLAAHRRRDHRDVGEASLGSVKEYLDCVGEPAAVGNRRLTFQGREVFAIPRAALLRTIMLNHWYHHRGQLSVYLRLLEVPVPVIYGRSADENPFA